MRAFLSYSRKDRDFASFFLHILALGAPKVELWMDERLDAGERYPNEIRRQVDRCDLFFAAVSPASLNSAWCEREAKQACARDDVEVIPLLIEEASLEDSPLGLYQYVDLRGWRIDGDRVLRAELLGRFGLPAERAAPDTGLHESLRAVVLWASTSPTPDPIGRHLADLATWQAANGRGAPLARARLLDALAGLHLTRREWDDMLAATHAALNLVREAGWSLPEAGGDFDRGIRSDDELGFLGELYNRLALGARQLEDPKGAHHGRMALEVFTAIRQPLLRREKSAQTHREMGTWAQQAGDHAEARRHFRESRRLLEDLPSQRYHALQATIKEAQIDLAEGDAEAARSRLDRVAPWFALDRELNSLLAHQVLPHFLLTDAACAAVLGEDSRAGAALDRHAAERFKGFGGRNLARRAAIRGLLTLPLEARGVAVRAALLVRKR